MTNYKIITGILIGILLVYGVQFVKAVTFQAQFTDPIGTCEYRDNVYWSWESLTFETNWICTL